MSVLILPVNIWHYCVDQAFKVLTNTHSQMCIKELSVRSAYESLCHVINTFELIRAHGSTLLKVGSKCCRLYSAVVQ